VAAISESWSGRGQPFHMNEVSKNLTYIAPVFRVTDLYPFARVLSG
jgi:hypothetical protein